MTPTTRKDHPDHLTYFVEGMDCASCVQTVERMVATLLGAAMALLLLFCFTIVGHLSVMVLLLFLALQRHYLSGLLGGSIKG